MAQLNRYLKFAGNCREAMIFYREVRGAELSLTETGSSAVGEQMAAPKESNMHSVLNNGNITIMGSDFHWGENLNNGNGTHICLGCDSEKEITEVYDKLSEGATIVQPLGVMAWGSMFALLIDKYERHWILNCDEPSNY